MKRRESIWKLLTLLSVFVGVSSVTADPYIPDVLKPFEEWVMHNHPERECLHDAVSGTRTDCVWYEQLQVSVQREAARTGAEFSLTVVVFGKTKVQLPYVGNYRPLDVRVDQGDEVTQGFVLRNRRGSSLELAPGTYEITGKFEWTDEPGYLIVPKNTAQIDLSIDNRPVQRPMLEGDQLWISRLERQPSVVADTLEVRVYRLLTDLTPQNLTTHIHLTVGGNPRNHDFGNVLPEGFEMVRIESGSPVRFDDQGHLWARLSRGDHHIRIEARANTLLNAFRNNVEERNLWPNQEVWGFQGVSGSRLVNVRGVDAIDLKSIDAPFTSAQGYLLNTNETLELIEEQRGVQLRKPGEFKVTRNFWVGFSGDSVVVADRIDAEVDQETRIIADFELGEVQVNSQPQLIVDTSEDGVPGTGVKLTRKRSTVTALSQVSDWRQLTAIGWNFDASSLSATLNLPPGWRLLWTTGVDHAPQAWLTKWRIWDIFLLLLLIVLVHRVSGYKWASIAAIAVLVSYQDSVVPTIGWLVLISLASLMRAIQSDKFLRWVKPAYWLVLVPLVGFCVFFAAMNARQAVFLQLEPVGVQAPISNLIYDQSIQAKTESAVEELVEELTVSGSFIRRDDFEVPSRSRVVGEEDIELSGTVEQSEFEYPPDLVVPTGPGTPTWRWHLLDLNWSGPVSSGQTMSLTLMSPVWSRILYVGIAVLVLVVSVYFVLLQLPSQMRRIPSLKALMPILIVGALIPAGLDVDAQETEYDLLGELEARLLAPPSCLPDCASIEQLNIDIDADQLRMTFVVHAGADLAVPILTVDKSLRASYRLVSSSSKSIPIGMNSQGDLYVAGGSGIFRVALDFDLRQVAQFELQYPLPPTSIKVDHEDWLIRGISDGVLDEDSISFDRSVKAINGGVDELAEFSAVESERARPYVQVTRMLLLELVPRMQTVVTRMAPERGSFTLQLPLLDGEIVLDEQLQVNNQQVKLTFDEDTRRLSWRSQLNLGDQLVLSAPDIAEWVETWVISSSNFWDYSTSGIPWVESNRLWATYKPRSFEELTVYLTKPALLESKAVTVESSNLNVVTGSRGYTTTLSLRIKASIGSEFIVQIPEGAEIKGIRIDRSEQPSPLDNRVNLSVVPGSHRYEIVWHEDKEIGLFYRTPQVELTEETRNAGISIDFPRNRWTIFLGGPELGAAVMFWGVLIVVLGLSLIISRMPRFPMSTSDAILLSVGATLANLWALLLVGIWMVGIWWRENREIPSHSLRIYRATQVIFVLVSVITIFSLIVTVPLALFGQPEMQITGYGSSGWHYKWFSDITGMSLPTAWVISLPNWIYLLAMLGWSLWLVLAIVKWVRKAWDALTRHGFWSPSRPLAEKEET